MRVVHLSHDMEAIYAASWDPPLTSQPSERTVLPAVGEPGLGGGRGRTIVGAGSDSRRDRRTIECR